jgi:hypothetical protein
MTDTKMIDETPRWMLYEGDGNLSGKQCALIDAIDACAWSTPGAPDAMTTEDAARIVGCDVESAWHALRALDEDTGLVSCYPPEDSELASRFDDADFDGRTDMETAAKALWCVQEDNWSDDDEFYAALIAASKKLGRTDAVRHWEAADADPWARTPRSGS